MEIIMNDIDKTQLANDNATQMMPAPGVEATQMAVSVTCPICKTTTPAGEQYCSDCGFLLSSAPEEIVESPEPAPALPKLIEPTGGREFTLNPGENTIGRENTDVLVMHPTVSRRHAKITVADGKYLLEDIGSTNGTYAGDKKVEPGQPVEVTSGMEIRFGSAVLRFEAPASDQAIASAESAREVEEAEELEEYSEESIAVEQAAEEPMNPPVEMEQVQESAAEESVEVEMSIGQDIESEFIATPEQSLEEPVQPVEIHEEELSLARLIPEAGGDVIQIHPGENTIGRRPTNKIAIADPYVSGSHAVITAEDGTFTLTDIGSTNGTFVNGEKLEPNQPRQLNDGDMVTFAQVSFRFTV